MRGLTLLLGGQKSGKSSAASRLAATHDAPVTVITPAVATDAEFGERIERHRRDRPDGWHTRETLAVTGALADGDLDTHVVIIDALDTWLLAEMRREGLEPPDDHLGVPDPAAWERVLADVDELCERLALRTMPTMVIAGMPGWGPIGATPLVRWYVDLHGLACQRLADVAHRTLLVVAGRAIDLDAHDVLSRPGTGA